MQTNPIISSASDRTQAPAFHRLESVDLLRPAHLLLSNHTPVFYINSGDEEVIKIDFIFHAGSRYETKKTLAHATNHLLNGGTSKLNSAAMAEQFDYFGAFFETEISVDHATVTLFCLNKHLSGTLPLIHEVLNASLFPEDELRTYSQNSKQKLLVKLEKNDYVAREKFKQVLFGEDHPYGQSPLPEDFERLERQNLLAFFDNTYKKFNCTIILSGKVDHSVLDLLEKHFGTIATSVNHFNRSVLPVAKSSTKPCYIEKKDALQSSIRIGKLLFNKTHKDFLGMKVLNEILGGYFGSRLMANIREDKGYTYGIGSGIVSLQDTGYFYIATDVGVEVTTATIDEIYKEIKLLQSEAVSQEELELVRNYMMGSFMSSLENVFSHAEKFKGIHTYGLDYSYYSDYFETIKNITPQRLTELANQYLDTETMVQVVVGKM